MMEVLLPGIRGDDITVSLDFLDLVKAIPLMSEGVGGGGMYI